MPDVFAGLPINDVDVADEAIGDFPTLSAKSERVASGVDGAIAAASFDLTTATPLEAAGVQPGHVLVIEGRMGTDPTTSKPKRFDLSDILPVASVSGSTVSLKRFGGEYGQGDIPAGTTQTTGATGLIYFIPTVVSRIRAEYADLWNTLGIVTAGDIVAISGLKKVTIWKVLRGMYFAQSREGSDIWMIKALYYDRMIKTALSVLMITYGDSTTQSHRPVAIAPVDDLSWRLPTANRQDVGPYQI